MPKVFVPFGEWLPDQPDFNNPGASVIKNVVPLTAQSYGGMPTPQVYSGALTARCQGAHVCSDNTNAPHLFAGDATKLYHLAAGSAPNFTDVSRTVGGAYTTGSPISPTIPTAPGWSIDCFGERVVATNYNDDVQTFLLGSDTHFSALAAGAAPKARFVAIIRDFVVLGDTTDGSFGAQPRRLWWSAIGNPLSWPTPGTNAAIQVQSDYQDLEQSDLGHVTGLIGGHLSAADGAAFCEEGIYRISYVGSAGGIFSFAVAEGAAGTQSPLSIVRDRLNENIAVAFYLGQHGFYAFDGMTSTPIGEQKVNRFVLDDIHPSYISSVQGGTVPNVPLAYWLYNSKSGQTANGLYDKMVIYHTVLQRWATVDLSATPAEWGLISGGFGMTLDQLDVFGSLDAVPALLDSNQWQGGAPVLSAFDANHKLNFINGPYMAPTVETSEIEPIPGQRAFIGGNCRVISDGGTPSLSIGVRDRVQDAVSFKTAQAMNKLGYSPQRVAARYVRGRATLPAGSSFTHLQGVDLDITPASKR